MGIEYKKSYQVELTSESHQITDKSAPYKTLVGVVALKYRVSRKVTAQVTVMYSAYS